MQNALLTLGKPVSASVRWVLLLAGLALSGGFLLAAVLKPDARGFGTHQQLGLPPCSFQIWFDGPCPGCGMTTSFSHFVRGQWREAYQANPAGLLLAVSCAGLIPWCWISAGLRRLLFVSDPWIASATLMSCWGGTCFLVWTIRWFT